MSNHGFRTNKVHTGQKRISCTAGSITKCNIGCQITGSFYFFTKTRSKFLAGLLHVTALAIRCRIHRINDSRKLMGTVIIKHFSGSLRKHTVTNRTAVCRARV